MQTPVIPHHNQGVDISNISQRFRISFCVYMIRAVNVRSTLIKNIEVHNTLLLTIGTMLYNRLPELIHPHN